MMDDISFQEFTSYIELLNLPIDVLEHIFSFLSYDEIAKNRIVCKCFNDLGMRLLNTGFTLVERQLSLNLRTIKAQLPRRESERRFHPLARHCEILTSIETRVSMLNMTYSKYIDNRMCCFIPGKVIDEIHRLLYIVETTTNRPNPPRAYEVLQELRDISSMAIEHFDDKIAPVLKNMMRDGNAVTVAVAVNELALGPLIVRQKMTNLSKRSSLNSRVSIYLLTEFKKMAKGMVALKNVVTQQRDTINKLLRNQKEQNGVVAELKKRVDECDIKYGEISHTNQASGGKAITAQKSASEASSSSSQPLRHFASQIKLDLSVLPIGTSKKSQVLLPNIKPRKTLLRLPSLSNDDDSEIPAKQPRLCTSPHPPEAPRSSAGRPTAGPGGFCACPRRHTISDTEVDDKLQALIEKYNRRICLDLNSVNK